MQILLCYSHRLQKDMLFCFLLVYDIYQFRAVILFVRDFNEKKIEMSFVLNMKDKTITPVFRSAHQNS